MANITVTYTFSNSTTADASQVNTNFTDLINGTSDGTKEFSISALTCAGTATFNGNVTLGNATSDDITWTGSLASSIPVKTTASYNIGTSSLGILSIYFGRNSQTVRVVPSASMAATYTLTLPVNVGTTGYPMVDSDGAGTLAFQNPFGPTSIVNASISASVATSALTVSLKDAAGSDPSTTSPVRIAFRSSTATTGTSTIRSVTSALSVVVSSGSTLGHANSTEYPIYVYAIDNAGTVELAVSTTLFDEGTRQSTTAEGGSGGADSGTVLYSTTARSNVAIRLIGRLLSTQTTAGTWAAVPTESTPGPFVGDASATRSGLVNTTTQTIAGNKTLSGTTVLGTGTQTHQILGRAIFNFTTETTAQLKTSQFFNCSGSGGTAAFSVEAGSSGMLWVVNSNTSEGALIIFSPSSQASIVSQTNGTTWSIGTGAGSDNRFSYNSSTGVMTITKNDAGTNSYQVFIIYVV